MMQARLSISVYLEDRTTYDEIMARYRKRVQAYIYLEKDGSPKVGPGDNPRDINDYWHNPKQFVNGLVQETCRDLAHTGAGIAAIGHIAEIARIQGTDLYAEKDFADRMKYALELHSQKQLDKYSKPVLCNKALEREFEGCEFPNPLLVSFPFSSFFSFSKKRRGKKNEMQTFFHSNIRSTLTNPSSKSSRRSRLERL